MNSKPNDFIEKLEAVKEKLASLVVIAIELFVLFLIAFTVIILLPVLIYKEVWTKLIAI